MSWSANLKFAPIRRDGQRYWRSPTDFSYLARYRIEMVPVAESELLNLAHHLPVLIDTASGVPSVVVLVAPAELRRPLVDDGGRWQRSYVPAALRCLPFGLEPAGDAGPEQQLVFAEELGAPAGPDGVPLLGEGGGLARAAADQVGTIKRAMKLNPELTRAAETLLLTDVLTAMEPSDGRVARLHSVDPARLGKISNLRCAILARDSFLPLQLLFAMLFSRRQLSERVRFDSTDETVDASAAAATDYLDLSGDFLRSFALDESELVPIDLLE